MHSGERERERERVRAGKQAVSWGREELGVGNKMAEAGHPDLVKSRHKGSWAPGQQRQMAAQQSLGH
jgi:hypothetical protein